MRFKVLIISILTAVNAAADDPAVATAAHAESEDNRPRSARILTDSYFFDAEFGAQQVAALDEFVAKKQRQNFLTTGRFEKKPKLSEISQRYGAPDLVVATKDFYLGGDDSQSYTVTAFYDRVGFSVYGKHQRSQTVHVVTLQYHDFSESARPKKGKYFYEVVMTKNRVFYNNGQEVGLHVYTDRMEWTTLGTIPAGEYTAMGVGEPYGKVVVDAKGNGKLMHFYPNGSVRKSIQFADGKYHGKLLEFSDQGWVVRESIFDEGRMHGLLKRFYQNGLKQAEANYYHGKIHGRAQEYHPNGTIRLKMDYAYGNPVSSLEEFDEQGKLVRSSAHPTQPDPKVGQRQGKSTPNPTAGGDQPLRKGAVPAS